MRESEAKDKACPWGVAPKCLARGCMAWAPLLDLYAADGPPPNLATADGERPLERDDGVCVKIMRLTRTDLK